MIYNLSDGEMQTFGIQQFHSVRGVEQGATDHEQSKGNLVTHAEIGGQSLVRWVDQQDIHGKFCIYRNI
jgi:hypothetical protein